MGLHHLPAQSLPREKLLTRGAASLSDAEMLAIVLRTGTAGRGVLQMAQELLAHFGAPWLRLRVTKPGANPAARAVGVEIERSRP